MRRRLPSPALVVASVALFLAVGGAGFAASLVVFPAVKSPKPLTLVPGKVSADGKVTGARVAGTRVSAGVYTLTIRGDTFSASAARGLVTPVSGGVTPAITISGKGVTTIPPQCGIETETIASNGSARGKVDCFAYNPAAGWQPADAGFDFQIAGPTP